MNGVLLKDHQFRGPSAIASGTVRAGTIVTHVKKGDWAGWVVLRNEDAPFFGKHDWTHRFVEVPETSVLPFGMKMYFIKGNHPDFEEVDQDLIVRAESPEQAQAFWHTHFDISVDIDPISVKEILACGPAGAICWGDIT